MLTRIIDFLKMRHVTAMFTTLTEGGAALENSAIGVSSLMDTWVSHDLRAPVRSRDGFAGILEEQHGGHLNEDARHCVQMIRDSAQHAGHLIDYLLAFSCLGQQPITKEPVSTEALVRAALRDLSAEQRDRRIDLTIGDLPIADADPRLLKQVWANLLSNALKFTRGRDPAVIQVGHEKQDGKTVYFVRDNGAGFDMRYAKKPSRYSSAGLKTSRALAWSLP